jgi:Flp pilus assembly protein TadG
MKRRHDRSCCSHRPATRTGAAAVEFAILASLVLVPLLLGMCELGRAVQARTILSDAARKGCRTGIRAGKSNADISSDVTNILNDNSISTTGVNIIVAVNGSTGVDASTANADDQISVKVQVPFGNITWGVTNFLSGATMESETMVMMRQAH